MLGSAEIGHNIPILGSLYNYNRVGKEANSSTGIEQTIFDPFDVQASNKGGVNHDDKSLNIYDAMISTPLCVIGDIGATQAFIDEHLKLHPPIRFIGVYSPLALAMKRQ